MIHDGPGPRQARLLRTVLERAFLRGLQHAEQDPPPADWGAQPFGMVRRDGGILAALHFPPLAGCRGVVVFGHPGIGPAKGYFHRSDRIPFVRSLGFAAMSFDHGGFGESDDPAGLFDAEWADALAWARRRHPGLPVHVWGVSLGGYFAHHALARDEEGVVSAVFEQVSHDLLEYADDSRLKAAASFAALLMPATRAWEAAETHAPRMAVERVLYVSGSDDAGVPPAHVQRLVDAAGPFARHHMVLGARHLEAWKRGGDALRKDVEAHLVAG